MCVLVIELGVVVVGWLLLLCVLMFLGGAVRPPALFMLRCGRGRRGAFVAADAV
jgi:hypothetical protein